MAVSQVAGSPRCRTGELRPFCGVLACEPGPAASYFSPWAGPLRPQTESGTCILRELDNSVESEPLILAAREAATGRPAPIKTNVNYHGRPNDHEGPFVSSQQAYDSMHIATFRAAAQLKDKQAADLEEEAKQGK
jgi:hypothetical protein